MTGTDARTQNPALPEDQTRQRFLASGDEAGTAPEDRAFRPDVEGLRAVAVLLVVLYHVGVPHLRGIRRRRCLLRDLGLRHHRPPAPRAGHDAVTRVSSPSTGAAAGRIIPAAALVIVVTVVASRLLLGRRHRRAGRERRPLGLGLPGQLPFHRDQAPTTSPPRGHPPRCRASGPWRWKSSSTSSIRRSSSWWRPSADGFRCEPSSARSSLSSWWPRSHGPSSRPHLPRPSAYFSPFTRAWELALGALVALGAGYLRRLPTAFAAVLTWLGLAGILGAALAFTNTTAYPGSWVALPVVATALVIAGGTAAPRRGAEALLSQSPFRWMGRWSYSLYLWHWPILVHRRAVRRTSHPSGRRTISSWPSWRWACRSSPTSSSRTPSAMPAS